MRLADANDEIEQLTISSRWSVVTCPASTSKAHAATVDDCLSTGILSVKIAKLTPFLYGNICFNDELVQLLDQDWAFKKRSSKSD